MHHIWDNSYRKKNRILICKINFASSLCRYYNVIKVILGGFFGRNFILYKNLLQNYSCHEKLLKENRHIWLLNMEEPSIANRQQQGESTAYLWRCDIYSSFTEIVSSLLLPASCPVGSRKQKMLFKLWLL